MNGGAASTVGAPTPRALILGSLVEFQLIKTQPCQEKHSLLLPVFKSMHGRNGKIIKERQEHFIKDL